MDFESPLEWFLILRSLVALFDGVVAAHDDGLGADEYTATLCLGLEWVVVTPHFHVMSTDLAGAHLIYDNGLLSLVAIPPYVVRLDERFGEALTCLLGLSCAGSSPMPLVIQSTSGNGFLSHHPEEINRLFDRFEFLKWNESFVDSCNGSDL